MKYWTFSRSIIHISSDHEFFGGFHVWSSVYFTMTFNFISIYLELWKLLIDICSVFDFVFKTLSLTTKFNTKRQRTLLYALG